MSYDPNTKNIVINVQAHGAVADYNPVTQTGTDNTAAILASIALANAVGGAVYFPTGNYLYSNIAVTVSNLEIYGDGAKLISNLSKTQNTVTFLINGGTNIYVHDLTFDFTAALGTSNATDFNNRAAGADCLRIIGTSASPVQDVRVERCTIYNARNSGISVDYAYRAHAHANTIAHTLGNGIAFFNCTEQIIATDNFVFDTGDDMLCAGTTTPTNQTAVVIFNNNSVKQGFAKGIGVFGGDRIAIVGNSVENTWAAGIDLIPESQFNTGVNSNIVVSGNIVKNAGAYFGAGLYKTAASTGDSASIRISSGNTAVKLCGNLMLGGVQDGISVIGGTQFDLSDNTILNHGGGHGINAGNLTDSTYSTISDISICNNHIQNIYGSGISLGGAKGGRISGNYIRSFGASNPGQSVGIQWEYLDSLVIAHNMVVNDQGGTFAYRALGTNTNQRLLTTGLWWTTGGDAGIADAAAPALPPVYGITGAGTWAPQGGGGITNVSLTANQVIFAPIQVASSRTLTVLGINVAVAGSSGAVIRFGVYRDNGGKPGTLLLDAGTSGASGVGFAHVGANLALSTGQYWLAAVAQGGATTQPTVACSAFIPIGMSVTTSNPTANAFAMNAVAGALPATFVSSGTVTCSPLVNATMT